MTESNILEFTQSLIESGDLQAAEKALRMRLRLPPAPEGAYLLMTDILIREAKYADAVQFISEHPENSDIFIRLRDYFIGERMNDNGGVLARLDYFVKVADAAFAHGTR